MRRGERALTREQKLALVLGFAAVLIVGLLISDHLAATRSVELDQAPQDSGVLVDASEGQALRRVVPLPIEPLDAAAGPDRHEVRRVAQGQAPSPQRPLGDEPGRSDEASVAVPGTVVVFENSAEGGVVASGPSRTVLEQVGQSIAGGLNSLGQQIEDLTAGVGRRAPVALGVVGQHAHPEAPASDQPQARTVQTGPVVVQHHVQANESLYRLAERYYGDGNKWRQIARDNADRVGPDGSVRQGVLLRILNPTRVPGQSQQRPATVAGGGPAGERSPTAQPSRSGGGLTYTVQPGDTLGEIAQKLLGTVRRQHELVALNRELIEDPDQLRVGMVLRLPSS
ncbi:MAG: hypothetical protein KatS3mg103_1354 [Phycisphaerales bacterium]|nr:MAG: hypothetical protein KatS3mg103_1354 [Phycisphaerales bacterium]